MMSGGLIDKVYIGLDNAPASFDIKGRILGPNGTNLEYIRSETGVVAVLKDDEIEPLHLALHHTRSEALAGARSLAQNLIEFIRAELAQWSAAQAGRPPPALNVPPPTLTTTSAPPTVPPPVVTAASSAHPAVIPPVVSVAPATAPLMTVRQPTMLQLLQPQQQYVLNQENRQLMAKGSQTMLIPYQQLQDLAAGQQGLTNFQPQQFVSIAPAGGLQQTSLPLAAGQLQQLQATGPQLMGRLSGEPHNLLAHQEITDTSNDAAWGLLIERYDNRRLIIDGLIDKIFKIPTVTNVNKIRSKILNPVTVAVNTLDRLKVSLGDNKYIVVNRVLRKLPSEVVARFEQTHGGESTDNLPTFDTLRVFLEDECRRADCHGETTSHPPPSSPRRTGGPEPVGPCGRGPKDNALQSQVCPFCRGGGHGLTACADFKAQRVQRRRGVVKQRYLCFRCLGAHFVRECSKTTACPTCGGAHHELLCLAESRGMHGASTGGHPPSPRPASGELSPPHSGGGSRRNSEDRPRPPSPPWKYNALQSQECPFCRGGGHGLTACAEFKAQRVQRRRGVVKQRSLCFRCLGAHFVRECSKTTACRTCGGAHHDLLCLAESRGVHGASTGGHLPSPRPASGERSPPHSGGGSRRNSEDRPRPPSPPRGGGRRRSTGGCPEVMHGEPGYATYSTVLGGQLPPPSSRFSPPLAKYPRLMARSPPLGRMPVGSFRPQRMAPTDRGVYYPGWDPYTGLPPPPAGGEGGGPR